MAGNVTENRDAAATRATSMMAFLKYPFADSLAGRGGRA